MSTISIIVPGNSSGNFSLKASCSASSMAVSVELTIEPLDRGVHFRLARYTDPAVTTRQPFTDNYETTAPAAHNCPALGVRFGTSTPFYTYSRTCENDRSASLSFGEDYDAAIERMSGTALTAVGGGDDGGLGSFFGTFVGGALGGQVAGKGSLQLSDALSADSFRVELPLSNGPSAVVTVPESEVFRRFANECVPPKRQAPKPDRFVLTSFTTWDERRYERNVQGVADALHKGIALHGVTPALYEGEISYIVQTIKRCTSISSEVASMLKTGSATGLGDQYKACYGTTPVSALASTHVGTEQPRGLTMLAAPIKGWQSGLGFGIQVNFNSSPADGDRIQGDTFMTYGVLDAVVGGKHLVSGMPGWMHTGSFALTTVALPEVRSGAPGWCTVQPGGKVRVNSDVDASGNVSVLMANADNHDLHSYCTLTKQVSVKSLMPDEGAGRTASVAPASAHSTFAPTNRSTPPLGPIPSWIAFGGRAYTRQEILEPNPQAPKSCNVPGGSDVMLKTGADINGLVTVFVLRKPELRNPACTTEFKTPWQNLAQR